MAGPSYADDCEPEKTAEAGGLGDVEDITYTPIRWVGSLDEGTNGDPVCDEVVARMLCTLEKTGPMSEDSIQTFDDTIDAWRDVLNNETSRQGMIDTCTSTLDASKEGWEAMGCRAAVE